MTSTAEAGRELRLHIAPPAAAASAGWSDLFRQLPEFLPHPLLRNGHTQTVVANYLPGPRYRYSAVQHTIPLRDGDVVVLHDDRPEGWHPGDRAVLLVHGLAGNHRSSYMVRLAGRLRAQGVRAFRMDLRACGAGHGLSRMPYHPGQTDDIARVLQSMSRLCPASPVSLVGFSLGGNLVLKLLGERADDLPLQLDCAVGVNPAIDLAACIEHLARPGSRFYDRHFVKLLYRQLSASNSLLEHFPQVVGLPAPRRLVDLDTMYTAPVWGFPDIDQYYRECSALPFISAIRIPTLILASQDDPVVPYRCFAQVPDNPAVMVKLTECGGHLGFIGQSGLDPDRRWMDWRILDWLRGPQQAAMAKAA